MKSPEAKLPPSFRFDREEANERSEPGQQSDQTSAQASAEASAEISDGLTFAKRIHQRFKGLGGDELVIPERQSSRPLPEFGQD